MKKYRNINLTFGFILGLFAMTMGSAYAGSWKNVSQVPAMLPSASAAVINDQIYVLSGTVGHGMRTFFEVYDPVDDGWRPLSPLPADIYDFALASSGNRLLVTGGRERETGKAVKNSWLYISNSALWLEVDPLPVAESGHAMVTVGADTFIIGTYSGKLLRFDASKQSWDIIMDLPRPTKTASVTTDGTSIFVSVDEGQVWRYDVKEKHWTSLPPLPQAVSSGALLQINGQLHHIGGVDKASENATEAHWILKDSKWQAATPLPQRRHNMASAVVGDAVYIIGGASGSGFFSYFTGSDYLYKYED